MTKRGSVMCVLGLAGMCVALSAGCSASLRTEHWGYALGTTPASEREALDDWGMECLTVRAGALSIVRYKQQHYLQCTYPSR